MPKIVQAHAKLGKYHDIEVEDEVNAYMEYEDGMVGNFIASTGEMPGENRLVITAEKGKVIYEGGKLTFIRNEIETSEYCRTTKNSFGTADRWTCDIPVSSDGSHQHRNVIENVANAILHGDPLLAPMEEGIRGLELGNAMLLSGLKNKVVTLPMDSAEYAEMLSDLIANSRYKKNAVSGAVTSDMSKSF